MSDLTEIYTLFSNIEKERINNMRISPTPNNIVSSRSHIFYELIITTANDKQARFVIVYMAGAENTIEIRNNIEIWLNFRPFTITILSL